MSETNKYLIEKLNIAYKNLNPAFGISTNVQLVRTQIKEVIECLEGSVQPVEEFKTAPVPYTVSVSIDLNSDHVREMLNKRLMELVNNATKH